VAFTPAATIVHLEGQSPLDDRALEMYRATYRFCRRTYSDGACRRIRAATVLGLLPRWLLARDGAARATYRALIALPMPDA
jgi:hypothetical protein